MIVYSFCLYGGLDKYVKGMIENIKLFIEKFGVNPENRCIHIHVDVDTVPTNVQQRLLTYPCVKCILYTALRVQSDLMLRRFESIDGDDVEIMFVRDADSRMHARDMDAMELFEKSDKKIHIIRDHPHHGMEILGGMWGVRKGFIENTRALVDKYIEKNSLTVNKYSYDQTFLTNYIYPLVLSDVNAALIHSTTKMHETEILTPLKSPVVECAFIGQVYDYKDINSKTSYPVHASKISLVFPTRKRPESIERVYRSAMSTSALPHTLEFCIYIDSDDKISKTKITQLQSKQIKYIAGQRVRFTQMWNTAYEQLATGDIVMLCSDDFVFRTPQWDMLVRDAFFNHTQKNPGDEYLLVYGDDGIMHGKLATHFFLSRKWIETVGYFTPPYFASDYCDTWVDEIATNIGRRLYIPSMLIEHMHMCVGKAAVDDNTRDRLIRHKEQQPELVYQQTHSERLCATERLINGIRNTRRPKIVFIDLLRWDYTPDTPYERGLGGTQSSVAYLSETLTKYVDVYLLNGVEKTQIVRGVVCMNVDSVDIVNLIKELLPLYTIEVGSNSMIRELSRVLGGVNYTKFKAWYHLGSQQKATICYANNPPVESIFVSEFQRTDLYKNYGYDKNKAVVLKNCVAPMFHTALLEGKRKPIIIYATVPDRGLEAVLDAFPKIRAVHPDAVLKIFSSYKAYFSETEHGFERLYERAKSMDGVEYSASISQSQLAEEMRQAMVYLYPTRTEETFCISAVEALASGMAVVAHDVGALRETGIGYIFLTADIVAQTNEILTLYKNNDERLMNHLRDQRLDVLKFYSYEIRAQEFIAQDIDVPAQMIKLASERNFGKALGVAKRYLGSDALSHRAAVYQLTSQIMEMVGMDGAGGYADDAYRFNPFDHDIAVDSARYLRDVNPNEAIFRLKRALELPDVKALTHRNLGDIYFLTNRYDDAVKCYETCVKLDAKDANSLMRYALITPVIYKNIGEPEDVITKNVKMLQLLAGTTRLVWRRDTDQCHLNMYNFVANDDRYVKQMMESISAYYKQHMPLFGKYTSKTLSLPAKNERIRLGIVSSNLRVHPAGKLNIGLIEKLPREKFEITLFLFPFEKDQITKRCVEAAHDVKFLSSYDHMANIKMFEDVAPHVLLYTDLGMDGLSYLYASMRLAPRQLYHVWGHPITTGLDTIDGAITMKYESPEEEMRYTEKIIKLNTLSPYYYRPTIEHPFATEETHAATFDIERYIDAGQKYYLCIQSLWKFVPQFVSTLTKLLKADKYSKLVLISKNDEIDADLKKLFAEIDSTLDLSRLVFIPRLDSADCLKLVKHSRVNLDTFPWGAGITAFESIAMGTPMITMPMKMIGSRFTMAMYAEMGCCTQCVAIDEDDYVHKAIQLQYDDELYAETRDKIETRGHLIFENDKIIDEWVKVLK